MTIFYYDVYAGSGQIQVPSDAAAIVAKATEGTYYRDKLYSWFKQQAANRGIPFSGYHFLNGNEDPAAQAAYYYSFAGSTPCMVDVEPEDQANSKPTVAQTAAFITALRGLGGHVWSVYYPHWYLNATGGSLASLGVPVVASEYRSYDDNDWPASYGGITPQIWQYTSTPLDKNAFKGTPAQLAAIINGDDMNPSDVWAFKSTYAQDPIDMRQRLVNAETAAEQANAKLDQVLAKLANLSVSGGGASPQAIAQETLAELKATL